MARRRRMSTRSDERSVSAKAGCCAMNKNIAGTPNIVVTLLAAMSASARPGSNVRCSTTSAPFWKATSVVTLSPPIWKTGAAVSVTSSARQSSVCMQLALFHQMLPWVSIAPLGLPVVPDVYMMSATSSSRTRTGSVSGGAPLDPMRLVLGGRGTALSDVSRSHCGSMTARWSASTMRALAAQSSIMKASSGPVRRKLSGTKIAPSRAAANMAKKNIGWLKPRKATRSRFAIPSAASLCGAILDRLLHLGIGPVAALEAQRQTLRRAQRALAEPVRQSDVRGHCGPSLTSALFQEKFP